MDNKYMGYKRTKIIFAILLVTVLTFGSIVNVSAAETDAGDNEKTIDSPAEAITMPAEADENAGEDTANVLGIDSEEGKEDSDQDPEESVQGDDLDLTIGNKDTTAEDVAASDFGNKQEEGFQPETNDFSQDEGDGQREFVQFYEEDSRDAADTGDVNEDNMSVSPVIKTVVESAGEDDSDEMFAEYVDRLFSTTKNSSSLSGMKRAKKNIGDKFTGAAQTIYSELYNGAQQIASGQRESSEFTFSVESLGYGNSVLWTAEDLGVDAVVADGALAEDVSDAAMEKFESEVRIHEIISALLADCPYELYWHDKTIGVSRGVGIGATYRSGEWKCYVSGEYVVSFAVAGEFAVSRYAADTEKTGAATIAVTNAEMILDRYSGQSDLEKLYSYKDAICEETDYNYAAANGGAGYGNPWQLIWVFDGDKSTKVVCEGYSKAFQYLCDRTDFENESICAYSVSGIMTGGTGAGRHMWNIVTLDDENNYLADVTNSDAGTIGQDGDLFLVPYTSGSVQEGYSFLCNDYLNISYDYDSSMFQLYSDQDLEIASLPYGTLPPLEILEQPGSVLASENDRVNLHVSANLKNTAYQWQWSKDGKTWKNCTSTGSKTDTFSFLMKAVLDGRIYRCRVSCGDQEIYSNDALITLAQEPLEILSQPEDVTGYVNETITLNVETNRDDAAYQWQWSTDGETWKNCTSAGCKTDTFSFLMKPVLNGRIYRCIVSCGNQALYSEGAHILLAEQPLMITTQPQDVTASANQSVSLNVETNRNDVTYQWQWSTDGETWRNCTSAGSKTDTFSFLMKSALNGRIYRCIVSCGNQAVYSDGARILLAEQPLMITTQPQDVTALVNQNVSLNVKTNRSNVTYQWQWSTDGNSWRNCTSAGYNTDTFSFLMKAALDGRYYRCAVFEGSTKIYSASAVITLSSSSGD